MGSENRAPEAGNKKYVAPIIYGYGYLSSKRRRRQTDASPSLPSLAARLTSRLVRHNTFETHLPRPDTTVEVVLRRRQHAIIKVKVNTPPRKKSCFRLPARGVAFVNPSPATEELRPRRRAGNDQRGGGGDVRLLIGVCLLLAAPPQLSNVKSIFLLNTEGR